MNREAFPGAWRGRCSRGTNAETAAHREGGRGDDGGERMKLPPEDVEHVPQYLLSERGLDPDDALHGGASMSATTEPAGARGPPVASWESVLRRAITTPGLVHEAY